MRPRGLPIPASVVHSQAAVLPGERAAGPVERILRLCLVAAGGGALSIPAARMGAEVLATDVAPGMLEVLRKRAAREGLAIRTEVMDGTDLDVGEQRFDRVCSEFGVMFFPDDGLPEMRRVLAPGQ